MSDLVFPTIHMNGTSKADLLNQVCDALSALRKAQEALQCASPNGRDYYVQEAGALTKALDQHCARLRKLNEVKNELEAIAEHIAEVER